MSADEPEPIGTLRLWSGGWQPVFECAVCLCLTADLAGHRKHMEHGR